MTPPAKENLPPKKRKENRPPLEVRNTPDWAGLGWAGLGCAGL